MNELYFFQKNNYNLIINMQYGYYRGCCIMANGLFLFSWEAGPSIKNWFSRPNLQKIWSNILLFDIIRPKKCLCPVFSRYWVVGWIPIYFNLFALSLPFHTMLKIQGGKQYMVNDFDPKKYSKYTYKSIHTFVSSILKQGQLFFFKCLFNGLFYSFSKNL